MCALNNEVARRKGRLARALKDGRRVVVVANVSVRCPPVGVCFCVPPFPTPSSSSVPHRGKLLCFHKYRAHKKHSFFVFQNVCIFLRKIRQNVTPFFKSTSKSGTQNAWRKVTSAANFLISLVKWVLPIFSLLLPTTIIKMNHNVPRLVIFSLLLWKFNQALIEDDSEFIIGNYDEEYSDDEDINANATNGLILDPDEEGKKRTIF